MAIKCNDFTWIQPMPIGNMLLALQDVYQFPLVEAVDMLRERIDLGWCQLEDQDGSVVVVCLTR